MFVEIEEIAKEFGTERALHPVSLSIPSGALIALLGPSGSGKAGEGSVPRSSRARHPRTRTARKSSVPRSGKAR